MVTKPPVVVVAERDIQKGEEWNTKEYSDAKPLHKEAKALVKNLHKAGLARNNIQNFRLMVVQLQHLERDERWQQFQASYSNLRRDITELADTPAFKHESRRKARKELLTSLGEEEVLEAGILTDTVLKIEPLVRNKQLNQITKSEWKRIVRYTGDLLTKIRGSVVAFRNMKKAIKKALST